MNKKGNDELFCFGANGRGEFGIGNNDDHSIPQENKFFKDKKIKQIACGIAHSLILTGKKMKMIFNFLLENDELYSFGMNQNGELGIGESKDQNTPQLVSFFNEIKIKKIYAGSESSFVLIGKNFNFNPKCTFFRE